jgi:hypothetical protein
MDAKSVCSETARSREADDDADSTTTATDMSAARRPCGLLAIVAVLGWAGMFAAQAGAATKAPTVTTGAATAVRGTSATLVGSVNPRGAATSYYFQYGPTIAYGKQTVPGKLPPGITKVRVGQAVVGILTGYHYRLVATNEAGSGFGKDRLFAAKATGKNVFTIAKPSAPTVYGGTYVLSGTLSGAGAANRALVLQSSPYPFLEAFTTIGVAIHTDAAGRFSFPVTNMTRTTQFRVSTLDPRPLYSRITTQQVAVKVTLKVRSSSRRGLVRLYGTVTPAKPGARLEFQLYKAVRPGDSPKAEERTSRFVTQFSTRVKRGTATVSRFSAVVKIVRGGSYRAYARLTTQGALSNGWSRTVLLRAAPARHR